MAIQEQIASDQAAVQQDGGLPSQAGTTTVGTITDTPVTQAGEYDELPGDEDTSDADTGPPEGWWTEHGYNSEAEAILSGKFIWDAETKSFVLKGGSTGGGTGGGSSTTSGS